MTRTRSLTHLELIRVQISGQPGVEAVWRRADGSKGRVVVQFRPRTPERWYIAWLHVILPTAALLRDVPLSRIEHAANADPKIRAWIEQGFDEATIERMRRDAAKRPRLERPAARRLDAAFYERVATAYRAAVRHGLPPAKTLAEDADTPQGTVNRWIAEARHLDYLPKAEPGKVTA
jgi:hypothetical protein